MAETLVSDVIVPEIFLPYVLERTAELSAFFTSGIIDTDSQFAALANGGGQTIQMPFWQDISGNSQVLSDGGSLTTKKIGASRDVAVLNNRGDAWKTNDLARLLSGDDPMGRIGDLVAAYWARDHQDTLISMLKGVFAIASMAGNLSAIHAASGAIGAANYLTGTTFIDGKQLLGDAKNNLAAIAMHSAVEASLLKQDLIDFMPDSEGKMTLPTFQGLQVIIDDSMPTETINSATVYTSYLFGKGAVAMGAASNVMDPIEGGFGTWELEYTRDALAGSSIMINRRRFILHPRGVKWLGGSMAGLSPTNTEFENASNWLRVFEAKHIRVVKITHNIAA